VLTLEVVAADTTGTQYQLTQEGTIMLASSSGSAAVLIILLIGLYLVPTIVAVVRKVTNQGSVAVINIFLGWSLIGWVVALAMACRTSTLVRDSVSSPAKEPSPREMSPGGP
jgi:hypothetical protein